MSPPNQSSPLESLSDEVLLLIIRPECIPNKDREEAECTDARANEETAEDDEDDEEDPPERVPPRAALPLVCRQWRRVCQETRTSLKFDGDPRGSELEEWLLDHPKISHVSFPIHQGADSVVRILKDSAPNVTSLTLLCLPEILNGRPIPKAIAGITGLKELTISDIFRSKTGGPIPASFTRLTALTSFTAEWFNHPIPALPLRALQLSHSLVQGLTTFTAFESLTLDNCPVPASLSHLTGLESLSLRNCSSGEAPPSLAVLSRLTRLELVTDSWTAWRMGQSVTCQQTLKELVFKPDTAIRPGYSRTGWGVPPGIQRCRGLRTVDLALAYLDVEKPKETAFLDSLPHLNTLTLWLEQTVDQNELVVPCEAVLQSLGRSKVALRTLVLTKYQIIPSTEEFWAQFVNLRRLELDTCGNPPPSLSSRQDVRIVKYKFYHPVDYSQADAH